jgi:hypothetical protein
VGQIEVNVSEPGAVVTVDGHEAGRAPLGRPIGAEAGSRGVRVRKEGFEPFETTVNVTARQRVTVDALLEREVVAARLVVTHKGDQPAKILIDGKSAGSTPWEAVLALGLHTVATQDSGGRAIGARTVELVKGRVEVVDLGRVVARDLLATVGARARDRAARTDRPAASEGRGVYGGFMFAGVFQLATADLGDSTCGGGGASCSTTVPVGGGVFAALGYMFDPVGAEILMGGTYEGSATEISAGTASGGRSTTAYDRWRAGGVTAVRARGQIQGTSLRASFAAGPTVALRSAGVPGAVSTYVAFGGTADAQLSIRLTRAAAVAAGLMLSTETPGSDIAVRGGAGQIVTLASGWQTFLQPHIGVDFGP